MNPPTPPAPSAGLSAERLAEILRCFKRVKDVYQLEITVSELIAEIDRLSAQKPGDGNASPTGANQSAAGDHQEVSPPEKVTGAAPEGNHGGSPAAPTLTDEDAITTYLACIAQHGDPGMDMGNWSDFVNRTLRSVRRISTLEASLAKAEADGQLLDRLDHQGGSVTKRANSVGIMPQTFWEWDGFGEPIPGNDLRACLAAALTPAPNKGAEAP